MKLEIGIEGNNSGKEFGKGHLIAAELRRSKQFAFILTEFEIILPKNWADVIDEVLIVHDVVIHCELS